MMISAAARQAAAPDIGLELGRSRHGHCQAAAPGPVGSDAATPD